MENILSSILFFKYIFQYIVKAFFIKKITKLFIIKNYQCRKFIIES